ncbi:DUF7527 domain-containing protein [Haloferacaceae archaeon DSL9]
MDREIESTIAEWETVPFDGGYDGIRALVDREFSGAITQGSAWLFVLNGRLLGVVDGVLSAFESADGTAYEAPDAALPLLFVMRERGGDVQAQYYTNDTPLAEADETLSSGNFTGYIELSENVLSGDYYTVYYGGQSMSAAFVGNSRRLITGDEAFERADDEVGIYTIRSVDIELLELPAGTTPASPDDRDGRDGRDEVEQPARAPPDTASSTADTSAAEPTTTEAKPTDREATGDAEQPPAEATDPAVAASESPSTAEAASDEQVAAESERTPTAGQPVDAESEGASPSDVFSQEAAWRNARSIPSIDPSESRDDHVGAEALGVQPPNATGGNRPETDAQRDDASAREQLERRLRRAQKLLRRADERQKRLVAERDRAREERDDAREEIDRLEARIESLEETIAELRVASEAPAAADASAPKRPMGPSEALAGTSLFVRYASKSGGTLEKAHVGKANREEVAENLRFERHTTFETEDVVVDGTPFEAFLTDRLEYQFTKWAVERLTFEIVETKSESGMSELFDSLPDIDRAEFGGTITVETPDGEDAYSFDVVLRDRMGAPLIVASFNDSREPASGAMLESLVEGGGAIAEHEARFVGAFAVSSSFFDPDALAAAADATGGGLLSRGKRKSYVKVARKRGFYLCLVETREGGFHMTVPEL